MFQRHRIDFCCRGELSLDAACRERGVAADSLVAELETAISQRRGAAGPDARAMSTQALVSHIVTTHHEYLRNALPFVEGLAKKVARVHGEHNPLLRELDEVVRQLSATLSPHLDAEEQTLFPALTAGGPDAPMLSRELTAMKQEHLAVGRLLERMRDAASGYVLPDWACNSYRTLFSELEQLEGDVLAHVHLENHVLMPRFAAA